MIQRSMQGPPAAQHKTSIEASRNSPSSMRGTSDNGLLSPSSDSMIRHHSEGQSGPSTLRRDGHFNTNNSRGTQEDFFKAMAQEEELMLLRKRLADASIKEVQLLNEKHALEKKFAELRLAFDRQQNDVITAALKALSHRKDDLEENLKLTHSLQIAEQDRSIFLSSLLNLLADYSFLPHVVNASSVVSNAKILLQSLQTQLTTSEARLRDIKYHLANQQVDVSHDLDLQPSTALKNHDPQVSKVSSAFDFYPHPFNPHEHLGAPTRFIPSHLVRDKTEVNNMANLGMRHTFVNDDLAEFTPNMAKKVEGQVGSLEVRDGMITRYPANYGGRGEYYRKVTADTRFPSSAMPEEHASSASEEEELLPTIEEFQIIGDAKPGNTLQACGLPFNGTSVCMFQWVRHLQDGTMQYVEGATQPEYVVTADDVDKLIAVECVPMDSSDRQGELVKIFANNQNKIACDPDMQREIETHTSSGQAAFSVMLLTVSSEVWEQATFILKRSSYKIRSNIMDILVEEKYSSDLSIKIPYGLSTQCVLTSSNGTSYPLRTNDVRLRDTLVLTMRIFQRQALEKKKGKM